MTIKEEFEKAFEKEFGGRPPPYTARWAAHWMAEKCAIQSENRGDKVVAYDIRQLAKELE